MELAAYEQTAVETLRARFFPPGDTARLVHRGQGLVLEVMGRAGVAIFKLLPAEAPEAVEALQARLDWVAHLHAHGLHVPALIPSTRGELVECATLAGAAYAAYAYVALPLDEASRVDWEVPGEAHKLGAVMGRMHALARAYQPARGRPSVAHWHAADWLRDPASALHPSQAAIVAAILELRAALARFPHDAANYGVIHDDLHTGNVFRLGDDLAILDFDCCHQAWFAADIASALLFRTWIAPAKETPLVQERAARFLRELCQGYRTTSPLPPGWRAMLPELLKLREISLYQSFYGQVDLAHTDDALCRYLVASIVERRPFLAMMDEGWSE
jgi:amicoumacin kinase